MSAMRALAAIALVIVTGQGARRLSEPALQQTTRIGMLAYQILLHRERGRPRTVFQPLAGEDWRPSRDLQEYLETGLHGSFSDFSGPNHPLAAQPKTPLDYEVRNAVEFLESQVENGKGSGSKIHNASE